MDIKKITPFTFALGVALFFYGLTYANFLIYLLGSAIGLVSLLYW